MPNLHCPICDKTFQYDPQSSSMPFCSARCKQIDLGRWLDERNGLPYDAPEDPDEPVQDGSSRSEIMD